MIRVSTYRGNEPGGRPTDVMEMSAADALDELVDLLFWGTRIEEWKSESLLIKCPDADPVLFFRFQSLRVDGQLDHLLSVAEWYAEATLLMSKEVFDLFKGEIKHYRNTPLAPIPE